jgi:hypothetical protein
MQIAMALAYKTRVYALVNLALQPCYPGQVACLPALIITG